MIVSNVSPPCDVTSNLFEKFFWQSRRRRLIPGYTDEQVGYHVFILIEAGLLEGEQFNNARLPSPAGEASRLTWAGHEFIDAARDDTRWMKVLGIAAEKAGS